ncbi:MAG: FkbM family methyltransferase [Microcoleaceae cyanobacterium MO_207.B10]|nr:FkbM family methyltransferase [Microcoleaceae cyanobacterium MO_207.B10]
MQIHRFSFKGIDWAFSVKNPNDAIQKMHVQGKLFDYPELEQMSGYINDGDLIIDIGSNVGNHAVFFSKFFPNSKIIVFEPCKEAIEILNKNLDLNECINVERKYIGFGLSNEKKEAMVWRGGANNLGGSRVIPMQDTSDFSEAKKSNFNKTQLITGDEVLLELNPSFIKIDVEGLEFEVLDGLKSTIAQHKPNLFIEIRNENLEQFETWRQDNSYDIVWKDTHYAKVTNFLIISNLEVN